MDLSDINPQRERSKKKRKPQKGESNSRIERSEKKTKNSSSKEDVPTSENKVVKQDCVICYEPTVQKFACGHYCHKSCIQKHFKSECPICRSPLGIKVYGEPPTAEDLTTPQVLDYYQNLEDYQLPNNEHLPILAMLEEFRQMRPLLEQQITEIFIRHGGGIIERRIFENNREILEEDHDEIEDSLP